MVSKALSAKVLGLNSAGSGAVTFSATQPKEGETVTAITTTMADADGLGVISLQWKANGAALSGKTADTLTLTEDMVGQTITVVASYVDGQGFSESKTSASFGPIINLNQSPQGSVFVANSTGTTITAASEDQVIKVVQNLSDTDGPTTLSLTYEWLAGDTIISGQTGSTLTLGQAQVGKIITARVKYTDGHDTNEVVTSTNSTTVTNLNDNPTGAVSISGTATLGQTLTASNTLADEDGIPTSGANVISYQWLADGVNIQGANASTLILNSAVAGKKISVIATYTDNQGIVESKGSTSTVAVGMTATRVSDLIQDVNGNLGQDILTGASGRDLFNVVANDASVGVDAIANFVAAEDFILLNLASFYTSVSNFALSTYGLTSGGFVPSGKFTTSTPTTTGATFIYQNGILSFDPDGSGSTVATQLVQLTGTPTLTADKILV